MLKILVTGSEGQLGKSLQNSNFVDSFDCYFYSRDTLDITNVDSVRKTIFEVNPDIVLNCAAYTQVDNCEKHQDRAFLVNALGARNIALVTRELDCHIVHISTDYVFDGRSSKPYTEFDKTNPLNIYGASKLAGEEYIRMLNYKHTIIRTSWLYGEGGNHFVDKIIKLANERDIIQVVNDQFGTPTYVYDLLDFIRACIEGYHIGLYHASNEGECSWYDFAVEILNTESIKTKVQSVDSNYFDLSAKRPSYSVLNNFASNLSGLPSMRSWKEALKDYLKGEKI